MATGSAEFIDVTTADVLIPEIWSKQAIVAREQKLLFLDRVNRSFEADLKVGDRVNITSRTHLTAQTKNTSSNAALTFETQTETLKTIIVDTWGYQGVGLETFASKQVNRDMLDFYKEEQNYALALQIDDTLAGLPDDFTNNVGTLIVDLTYEDVLAAILYLDKADAPAADRSFIISPDQKAGFGKLDQFVHGDYGSLNSGASPASKSAALGSWLNHTVFWSNNVEGSTAAGHDNALFQRDAIGCVVQMSPTTHTMFDINYLTQKVVVEQSYGVLELRDDHGVWMKGA